MTEDPTNEVAAGRPLGGQRGERTKPAEVAKVAVAGTSGFAFLGIVAVLGWTSRSSGPVDGEAVPVPFATVAPVATAVPSTVPATTTTVPLAALVTTTVAPTAIPAPAPLPTTATTATTAVAPPPALPADATSEQTA